jgi:MFS family permease
LVLWKIEAPRGSARGRRLAVVGSLFLVSDIGYSFLLAALATILLQRGVALETVGLINLLGTIYFARFLVGPLVDRFGHYRRWLISTQVVLVLAFCTLSVLDPVGDLPTVLAVVTVLLVVSAVHDTALGGLSVRLLPPGERGTGNGVQSAAAVASIFIGGGGALLLYAYAGWTVTTLVVASVFTVPLAVLARFTEPVPPQDAVGGRGAGWRDLLAVLRVPRTALWALAVIPCFVVGMFVVTAVQTAMLLAAGWTVDRIAFVQYTLAVAAGMATGVGTGVAISRWGRRRTVVVIGAGVVVAVAAHLPLAGGDGGALAAVAVLLATAVYCAQATWIYTVCMDLSRGSAAATDFTVQTSVSGVVRMVTTGPALVLAGQIGYPWLVTGALGLALAGAVVTATWARSHTVP